MENLDASKCRKRYEYNINRIAAKYSKTDTDELAINFEKEKITISVSARNVDKSVLDVLRRPFGRSLISAPCQDELLSVNDKLVAQQIDEDFERTFESTCNRHNQLSLKCASLEGIGNRIKFLRRGRRSGSEVHYKALKSCSSLSSPNSPALFAKIRGVCGHPALEKEDCTTSNDANVCGISNCITDLCSESNVSKQIRGICGHPASEIVSSFVTPTDGNYALFSSFIANQPEKLAREVNEYTHDYQPSVRFHSSLLPDKISAICGLPAREKVSEPVKLGYDNNAVFPNYVASLHDQIRETVGVPVSER